MPEALGAPQTLARVEAYEMADRTGFAYNIARDLNATILHLLGLDHNRFTFRFRGLHQRLPGVGRR